MAVNSKKNAPNEYDFGGYATKYNTKCSDGRTIMPNAFAHSDKKRIPLVWQHFHDAPDNVLGHVVLEHREDGVYAHGLFNQTEAGKVAKVLVHGKDIEHLSIYANKLVERDKIVHSGMIREVSLVLSGANPGAVIDHLSLQHSDGTEEEIEDEAIIFTNETLEIISKKEAISHANGEDSPQSDDEETLADILDSLSEKQRAVVYAMLAEAVEFTGDLSQSSIEEGEMNMKENVFDQTVGGDEGKTLTHDEMAAVFADARKIGSLKEAVLKHAGTYGIDDIGYLFPDAKLIRQTPDLYTRDMSWVGVWMSGTHHTPFSRIKNVYADLTPDEVRAKGYTTGDQKIEEVFAVLKRETTPQTMYKLQRLDRDDILDITDFNVVSWLKSEMRMMLEEEIARACLVGDGRTFGTDDDAVNPEKVRNVLNDDAVYSHKVSLAVTVTDYADIIDAIIGAFANYRGTGSPTMFIAPSILTNFLLLKDTTGRRIYRSVQELASELRVSRIVEVEVMEGVQRDDAAPFTADLLAIILNPRDFTIGADKGGAVAMFDDFDIDYNQYKYLIETRISAALTRPKSALVIERKTA